jgi:hypothetical protein
MAKVRHISLEMIKAMSGIIDFYYWKGIPVARKWPDWTHFRPSPRQKEAMEAMKKIWADIKKLSPEVLDLWRRSCVGKTNSWVDLFKFLWYSYWKKGIDPAPVLTKYTKTETDTEIILEMDFTTPISSEIHFGDGFWKGTRRTMEQKGRQVVCWDPPKPKAPKRHIDPEEIEPPFGKEEILTIESVEIQTKYGQGWGPDFSEAVFQAWDEAINSPWYDTRDFLPGVEVYSTAFEGGENEPIQYSVLVLIHREYLVLNDYIWKQKHPDIKPTHITNHGHHYIGAHERAKGHIKVGYAEDFAEDYKSGSYFFYLPYEIPDKEIYIRFSEAMKGAYGYIFLLFQPDEDTIYISPEQPQPGEETYAGWTIYPEYDPYSWYIGKQGTTYSAIIPKEKIAGLSEPVAFIYSHNQPAVAPPIPL